jgi:nucleoside-diphosphate-sugar epimerase
MTEEQSGLRVLFVGGTGTISASCVRLAAKQGMQISVLNRSNNSSRRQLPDGVVNLVGDMTKRASVEAALGTLHFDAVVNFLSFTAADTAEAIDIFRSRTDHYIHISTAALYAKPVLQVPIVESTLRKNVFLQYARDKIAAEEVVLQAHLEGKVPATIVRPSHTYDEASPPLAGGWTIFDRIEKGQDIVVHGDGTSLWTLTHAADFAQGLVGLIGNQRAHGEVFHITSDDVYTWDQIYNLVGSAVGVAPKLVHVPSEFYPIAAPDWFWSELVIGDLSHSAIFDNSKIRRFVPGFAPERTFIRSVTEMAQWRSEHPTETEADSSVNAIIDRLATGYHQARAGFEALGSTVTS